jgi:hypothetical protein
VPGTVFRRMRSCRLDRPTSGDRWDRDSCLPRGSQEGDGGGFRERRSPQSGTSLENLRRPPPFSRCERLPAGKPCYARAALVITATAKARHDNCRRDNFTYVSPPRSPDRHNRMTRNHLRHAAPVSSAT